MNSRGFHELSWSLAKLKPPAVGSLGFGGESFGDEGFSEDSEAG